ncbi:MAG: hypothetical protein GY835_21105 [bacterium]|nr:hypothetical protein [bacterium]
MTSVRNAGEWGDLPLRQLSGLMLLLPLMLLSVCATAVAADETADESPAAISAPFDSLLNFSFRRHLAAGEVNLDLGVTYLVPGSETVWWNGVIMIPGDEYRLHPEAGSLELDFVKEEGVLEVTARRLRIPLQRVYMLNPLRPWREMVRDQLERTPREINDRQARTGQPGGGSITMGGSKSLMLRMGSGESVVLEQNLRLNLRGMLSDSTMVEAVLRDDDLPFQPEGNTERLDELDKIFIRINGPAGQAQVGDFVFTAPGRLLTPFNRDFQGLQGDLRHRRGQLSAWLAQSRGLFKSLEFYGEDGLQGPYELLSAMRSNGAVILAGSERVRLNGRLLTRGRNRDFTIDYDLGTISFNTIISIGSGDVIRVDFRYSQEDWRRNAWGVSGATSLGPLRLDYLHFSESDDPADPLAFSLTSANRELIAAAGDSTVITSGTTEAPGTGHYVLTHENPDNPEMVTYAWVDTLGNYNLRFHEVGAGLGDYTFSSVSSQGERIFSYRGEGQGTHKLGLLLTAPESYMIESLRLDLETERCTVNAEVALSNLDRNSLSTLDDGDNAGLAVRADLRCELGAVGERDLAAVSSVKTRAAEFSFPGVRYGSDHYRAWNLPLATNSYSRLSESEYSAGLIWGEMQSGGILLNAERMELGDRFTGNRLVAGAEQRWGQVAINSDIRVTETEDELQGAGRLEYSRLGLTLPLPLLRGVQVERELAANEKAGEQDDLRLPELRNNYEWEQAEVRFGNRGTGGRNWRLTWSEKSIRSGAGTKGHLRQFTGAMQSGLPRDGRLEFHGHYQNREGMGAGEQFQAETNLNWYARPGGWGGDLLYRLGSRKQRLRRTQLVYIGLGLGDRNQEGIYLGEGEGDYRRVSLPSSDAVRTIDLALELQVVHDEAREGPLHKRLGSETRLTLREETRDDELWRVARLDLSRLRRDDSTLFGSIELKQELRYRMEASNVDFRYNYLINERLDDRDAAGRRRENDNRHKLQVRNTGQQNNLELMLERTSRERKSESSLDGGTYDVSEYVGDLSWTRHLGEMFSATVKGGLARRRDLRRELTVNELLAEPALGVRPWRDLRLNLSLRMTRSSYSEGDPAGGRPWFFDPPGWEQILRVEGTIQAGRNLTLSLRYEMRDEVDREKQHSLRMESRAYF